MTLAERPVREHGDPKRDTDYYTKYHPRSKEPGLRMAATGLFMEHMPFAKLGAAKQKEVAREAERLHEMGWVTPVARTRATEGATSGSYYDQDGVLHRTNGQVTEGFGLVTMELSNRMSLNGYSASKTPGGVFRHEYAHVLVKSLRDDYIPAGMAHPSRRLEALFTGWLGANDERAIRANISSYAWDRWSSDQNWEEAFADAFTIITSADYAQREVPLPFEAGLRVLLDEIRAHPRRLNNDEAMQQYDPETWARWSSHPDFRPRVNKHREHGSKDDPNYERDFHPGLGKVPGLLAAAAQGGRDPMRNVPPQLHASILSEVRYLERLGFTEPIYKMGTLDFENDPRLWDWQDIPPEEWPVAASIGLQRLIYWNPDPKMTGYSTAFDTADTLRHEYFHILWAFMPEESRASIADVLDQWTFRVGRDEVVRQLSEYAVESQSKEEVAAEAFTTITRPGYRLGTLPWDGVIWEAVAPFRGNREVPIVEHGTKGTPGYEKYHPDTATHTGSLGIAVKIVPFDQLNSRGAAASYNTVTGQIELSEESLRNIDERGAQALYWAAWDKDGKRLEITGPELPEGAVEFSGGAAWEFAHEAGHAWETQTGLDSDFDAMDAIGRYDPEAMLYGKYKGAFITKAPDLHGKGVFENSLSKNPSEAMADLFADYVQVPSRMEPSMRAWVEQHMTPEWQAVVENLRAHPDPRDWVERQLREHGDPDVNPDYYTNFHPRDGVTGALPATVVEFEQKWANIKGAKSEAFLIVDEDGKHLQSGLGAGNRATTQHIDTSLLTPGRMLTHLHPDPNWSPDARLSWNDLNSALRYGITMRAFQPNGSWEQFVPEPSPYRHGLDYTVREMNKKARARAEKNGTDPTDERDWLLAKWASERGVLTRGVSLTEHGNKNDPNYYTEFHPGYRKPSDHRPTPANARPLSDAIRPSWAKWPMPEWMAAVQGKPDALVTVYRGISPYNTTKRRAKYSTRINPGDWVSTTKDYALLIGHSDRNILTMEIPAGELYGGGDEWSEWEWAWWPQGYFREHGNKSDPNYEALFHPGWMAAKGSPMQRLLDTGLVKTVKFVSAYAPRPDVIPRPKPPEKSAEEVRDNPVMRGQVEVVADLAAPGAERLKEMGFVHEVPYLRPEQYPLVDGTGDAAGVFYPHDLYEDGGGIGLNPYTATPWESANGYALAGSMGFDQGDTFRHEYGHALYFEDSEFRKGVNEMLDKWLVEMPNVFNPSSTLWHMRDSGSPDPLSTRDYVIHVISTYAADGDKRWGNDKLSYRRHAELWAEAFEMMTHRGYGGHLSFHGEAFRLMEQHGFLKMTPGTRHDFAEHGDPDETPPDEYAKMHPGSKHPRHYSGGSHELSTERDMRKHALAEGVNARVAEFRAQGGVVETEGGGVGSDAFLDTMAADMGERWGQSRGVQFTRQAIERGRRTRREKPDLVSGVITAWTMDPDGNVRDVAGALNYFVMDEFRIPFGKTYKRKYMYLDYVGSTGILKGVGSALTREVVLEAAKRRLPLLLTADPPAESYWRDVWGMQRNPFNFDLGGTWSRMSGSDSLYGLMTAQVKDLAKRLKADGSLVNAHFTEIAVEVQYDPDEAPFRDLWLASMREHGNKNDPNYYTDFHPLKGTPHEQTVRSWTGYRDFDSMWPNVVIDNSGNIRKALVDPEMGAKSIGQTARDLLTLTAQAPHVEQNLYRGLGVSDESLARLTALDVGMTLDMNLSAWSGDQIAAMRYFSEGERKTGKNAVLFVLARGAHALSTEGMTPLAWENEYLTSGRFEVLAKDIWRPPRGKPVLRIMFEQIEPFERPDQMTNVREHGDKADPNYERDFHPGSSGRIPEALARVERAQADNSWGSSQSAEESERGVNKFIDETYAKAGVTPGTEPNSADLLPYFYPTYDTPGSGFTGPGLEHTLVVYRGPDGKRAGYLLWRPTGSPKRQWVPGTGWVDLPPGSAWTGQVMSLEVLDSQRGKGIATAMYDWVQENTDIDLIATMGHPMDEMTAAGRAFAIAWLRHRQEMREHGDPETMSADEYARYHPGQERRQLGAHLQALLKSRARADDRGRMPKPEVGPRTGFPEPYDPNRPQPGGLISHDDYLYWTAATEPRLEAIRASTKNPGSLGDRLHGAIEASVPTTDELVRGARYSGNRPTFFEGQRLFLPLISFSTHDVAWRYASKAALERAGMTLQPALLYLESGAKAFKISDFAAGPYGDAEWVTMGVFEVVSSSTEELPDGSRVPKVTIRQVGVQPRAGRGMAQYREHGDPERDADYAARFHPGGGAEAWRSLFEEKVPFQWMPHPSQLAAIRAGAGRLAEMGFTPKVPHTFVITREGLEQEGLSHSDMPHGQYVSPNDTMLRPSRPASIGLNPKSAKRLPLVWLSPARDLGDVFRHEYGHYVLDLLDHSSRSRLKEIVKDWRYEDRDRAVAMIGALGGGDPFGSELWAEVFRTITDPDYEMGALPFDAEALGILREQGLLRDQVREHGDPSRPNYRQLHPGGRREGGLDPRRAGRCYELAGGYVMDNQYAIKGLTLVHGSIQGFDNPRIGHAWVVLPDGNIYEPYSNKEWDRVLFDALFNPLFEHEYTADEAMKWMVRTEVWGPWQATVGKTKGKVRTWETLEEHGSKDRADYWKYHPAFAPEVVRERARLAEMGFDIPVSVQALHDYRNTDSADDLGTYKEFYGSEAILLNTRVSHKTDWGYGEDIGDTYRHEYFHVLMARMVSDDRARIFETLMGHPDEWFLTNVAAYAAHGPLEERAAEVFAMLTSANPPPFDFADDFMAALRSGLATWEERARIARLPLAQQIAYADSLREHGDKSRADYAARYHPGTGVDAPPYAPGEAPLEPGKVRVYHYTRSVYGMEAAARLDSIRREGLDVKHARGATYGEPNVLWVSAQMPDPATMTFIELHVTPEELGMFGARHGMWDQAQIDRFMGAGANATLVLSQVPPERIVTWSTPGWTMLRRWLENDPLDRPLSPDRAAILRNVADLDDTHRWVVERYFEMRGEPLREHGDPDRPGYDRFHPGTLKPGPATGAPTMDALPAGYYDDSSPLRMIHGDNRPEWWRRAYLMIDAVRGRPGDYVTIYRGIAQSGPDIRPGDWVTQSPVVAWSYAGESGRVVSTRVPAGELYLAVNDGAPNEWVWWPEPLREHGSKDDPDYSKYHPDTAGAGIPSERAYVAKATLDRLGTMTQGNNSIIPDWAPWEPHLKAKGRYEGPPNKVVHFNGSGGTSAFFNGESVLYDGGGIAAAAAAWFGPGKSDAAPHGAVMVTVVREKRMGWGTRLYDEIAAEHPEFVEVVGQADLSDEGLPFVKAWLTGWLAQHGQLQEHGDKNDPNYERDFHPGTGTEQAKMYAGWDEEKRADIQRWINTGLFRQGIILSRTPEEQRQLVLEEAERLHEMGFQSVVQDITDDPRSFDEAGRVGEYDSSRGRMKLNPHSKMATGYSTAYDLGEAFRHEYGHLLWFEMSSESRGQLRQMIEGWARPVVTRWVVAPNGTAPSLAELVSQYAAADWDQGSPVELHAELFTIITHPGYQSGTYPFDSEFLRLHLEDSRLLANAVDDRQANTDWARRYNAAQHKEHGDPERDDDYEARFHPGPEGITKHGRYRPLGDTVQQDQWERDHFGGALHRLTPQEADTLRDYANTGSKDINAYLRGERDDDDWGGSNYTKAISDRQVADLDGALARNRLAHKVILFRSVSDESVARLFGYNLGDEGLVGATGIERGFLSTSTTQHIWKLIGSRDALLRLRVPAGTPAMSTKGVSWTRGEREVLLARGLRLRVRSVNYDEPYGPAIIDVDVILPRKWRNSSISEHGDPERDADYEARYHPGPVGAERAVKLLAAGKSPNVHPESVQGLLKQAATSPTPLDLAKVRVNGAPVWSGGMGVARAQMPSLPSTSRDAFFDHLRSQGVGLYHEAVNPRSLVPMQGEIDAVKTGQMFTALLGGALLPGEVIATRDNMVLDGHHRWGAGVGMTFDHPDLTIPVLRIDMNGWELLALARSWTEVQGIPVRRFGEAEFFEHGDPERDPDYYTKYHPRTKGAMTGFTGLKGAQIVREELRAGAGSEVGAELIHAINDAPASAPILHRGVGIKKGQTARTYKEGAEVWLNLSSWTTNEGTAEHFAQNGARLGDGWEQVLFTLDEGAKAINASGQSYFEEEGEWVTAGLFRVAYAFKDESGWTVYLTQIGTFEDAQQVAKVPLADYGKVAKVGAKPKRAPLDERWPEFTEHGDKSMPDYEAKYHPGYLQDMAGPKGVEGAAGAFAPKDWEPPKDEAEVAARLRATGLFEGRRPYRQLTFEDRQRVLEAAEGLAAQGYDIKVTPIVRSSDSQGGYNGAFYWASGELALTPTWAFNHMSASRHLGDVFRHEYGHAVYMNLSSENRATALGIIESLRDRAVRREGLYQALIRGISTYFVKGEGPEAFAEYFQIVTRPEYVPGTLEGDLQFWEAVRPMRLREHGDPERDADYYTRFHPKDARRGLLIGDMPEGFTEAEQAMIREAQKRLMALGYRIPVSLREGVTTPANAVVSARAAEGAQWSTGRFWAYERTLSSEEFMDWNRRRQWAPGFMELVSKPSPGDYSFGGDVGDFFRHEYGHALDDALSGLIKMKGSPGPPSQAYLNSVRLSQLIETWGGRYEDRFAVGWDDEVLRTVSAYAAESYSTETMAEVFAVITDEDYVQGTIPFDAEMLDLLRITSDLLADHADVAEHGDPSRANYERDFHPGWGADEPTTGLLLSAAPFTDSTGVHMPPERLAEVVAEAERLEQAGFTVRVATGLLHDKMVPLPPGLVGVEYPNNWPMGGTSGLAGGDFVSTIFINPAFDRPFTGFSTSRNWADVFRHEYGHALLNKLPSEDRLRLLLDAQHWAAQVGPSLGQQLSEYAYRASLGEAPPMELLAEAFARIAAEGYERGTISFDGTMIGLLKRYGLMT